jgi:hypothetical protein
MYITWFAFVNNLCWKHQFQGFNSPQVLGYSWLWFDFPPNDFHKKIGYFAPKQKTKLLTIHLTLSVMRIAGNERKIVVK